MSIPFDPLGPLPDGTTVLEASAGTGKTYAIAALTTRYIAHGVARIDQILLITFGRAATKELRERVRRSLTTARDALRTGQVTGDAVIDDLVGLPEDDRRRAADRLARAVADFDAGTIATTHQFCQQSMARLGLAADIDPGETFAENIVDLVDEVVDDFYVRKYSGGGPGPRLPYEEARTLARLAVSDPQAHLDAGPVTPETLDATRVSFAHAVRLEVLRRRRTRRLVTFDDLVLRLSDALTDATTGEQACERLREAYQVVLVDEFQDTDTAQWSILKHAFHGHRTLILIGDPKQAIYAFRGADVFSYLDAVAHANHHATLPTNWRSDEAVIRGVAAVMGGLELGDPRIVVPPVQAHHVDSRIALPHPQRVRLRTYCPQEAPAVTQSRAVVAADVAADIADLLSAGTPLRIDSNGEDRRPVAPRDIAVLVGTHAQADMVRTALLEVGVPAVVTSASSVFATPAAAQWSTLLTALQRPRGGILRDVALTDFFGMNPADLALRPDAVDAEVSVLLRRWADLVDSHSVAEMMAAIESDTGLAARLLSQYNGERTATDIRHLAHVLHTQQRARRAGLVALGDWLRDQIRRATEVGREPTSELTRRLDTDAEAVQVLTVHTSKGLEFPVVYVPYGWDRSKPSANGPLRCHDGSGRRVLDVRGPEATDRAHLLAARDAEDAGESLRLLYVALTRASSLLVVHWASSKQNTRFAPLHRALSAQAFGDAVPKPWYSSDAPPRVDSPWISTEPVGARPELRWSPAPSPAHELSAATFTRTIDLTWRRTSYSGLTRAIHEAEHRPLGFRDDEPEDDPQDQLASEPEAGLVSPFATMPAGAAFGTLVHAVLEVVDTGAADLEAQVHARSREQLVVYPVDVSPDDLALAITPAMRTPLGALASQSTLAQFSVADRLTELDFELPMGNQAQRTLKDLADLLRTHLSSDDPLADYPDRLEAAGLGSASLKGYLAGSIDAVLRTGDGRFLVVDYKTNLLRDPARPGVEALVEGYRPARLATAMMDAHYPLQAVLYCAALHRYLRWRLPGYDPHRHFGGVLYLFVRGMAGPDTPDGCGVFSWRPAAELVTDLSDLLDGRLP